MEFRTLEKLPRPPIADLEAWFGKVFYQFQRLPEDVGIRRKQVRVLVLFVLTSCITALEE
jgi:hypothetical protein